MEQCAERCVRITQKEDIDRDATTRGNTQFHLGSASIRSGSRPEEEAPGLNQLSPFVKEVADSIAGKRRSTIVAGSSHSRKSLERSRVGVGGMVGGVSGDACDIHMCTGPAM